MSSAPAARYQLMSSHSFVIRETKTDICAILNDRELTPTEKEHRLEHYFYDVYHLFLGKFVRITHEATLTTDEENKLRALLDELLKVKSLFKDKEQ